VGVDFDQLEALDHGRSIGRVSLLLLADSGYAPLNPPEWLSYLNPQVAWSAGDSQLGPELAAALVAVKLLAVQEHGWLRVTTDGATMWIQTAR
jgi:hypothetical protein